MRELVNTQIRVSEIQPGTPNIIDPLHALIFLGMVETEFSIIRYRGDKSAASKVYEGIQPRKHATFRSRHRFHIICVVTPEDIAEEIVWAASRPPHVNLAEVKTGICHR